MSQEKESQVDVIGVGIGPFNLSVAALLQPLTGVRSRFFDQRPEFQWHPGLLFPGATIQVSYLKDLVTLADPTNPYSFLSFLFKSRRLYRFINANYTRVTRLEFNQYLKWVCDSLPNLNFNCPILSITCDDTDLLVETAAGPLRCKNIILGTGLVPLIPECARPHLGPSVIHASRYLQQKVETTGRRVAVIGGGQTGAEIIDNLLSNPEQFPRELFWLTRRANFLPIDESPFTNELFTPNYSSYFFNLPQQQRASLLVEQKLASDGIMMDLLEKIYRRLYELEFLSGHGRICKLYSRMELIEMNASDDGWSLIFKDSLRSRLHSVSADVVILCTGLEYKVPDCINGPLLSRLPRDSQGFRIREDFSLDWDGSPSLKIYVQNAARHVRGIADPNLSLMAWRSAKIINSLMGRCVYDVEANNSPFDWAAEEIAEHKLEGAFK